MSVDVRTMYANVIRRAVAALENPKKTADPRVLTTLWNNAKLYFENWVYVAKSGRAENSRMCCIQHIQILDQYLNDFC